MAHVNFDGLNLRLTLDRMERTATHRREFVVPRANLASVEHQPDVWDAIQPSATLMGIAYHGIVLIGTAETRLMRDFCVLYRNGPGLVIGLRNHGYDRILLSMGTDEAWPLFVRLREVTSGQRAPAGRE